MRKRPVILAPVVEREIDEISTFIAQRNREAAIRFIDALERTFEKIGEEPERAAKLETTKKKLSKIRCWQIREFENYLVLYRPYRDRIEILHVTFGGRDIERLLEP